MKVVYFSKLQKKKPNYIHLLHVLMPSQHAAVCQKWLSIFFKVGNFVVLLETIHYLVNVGDVQLVPHCFNLICSSGPHWTRRPGSWREGTKPETESCDAHNRVQDSFSWLPCLAHSVFGAEPVAVTQDVVDNLRFVARHHLFSGTASTRQQTWKHESAEGNDQWSEQSKFKITTITSRKTGGKRKSAALAKRKKERRQLFHRENDNSSWVCVCERERGPHIRPIR